LTQTALIQKIPANPLLDLARFMVNCSDAEIRREIEYETVDLYYTLLQEEYKKHGAEPAFSRNQVNAFKLKAPKISGTRALRTRSSPRSGRHGLYVHIVCSTSNRNKNRTSQSRQILVKTVLRVGRRRTTNRQT
jgi:hypothetical protein